MIRAAVDQALDNGISFGASNMTEARFARAVCDRFGLERVRFTNSGTEANLLAISLARIFTRPQDGDGVRRRLPRRRVRLLRRRLADQRAVRLRPGAVQRHRARRGALIAKHADDLALVILEPMIGSGGCIPADHDFLRMLREETARVGALLIFDEVMTSRLAPGGLQSVAGVKPDLTTFGKYIGGGMSFGAFGGRAEIMDLFDPRRPDALPHAGTFNNNVLTMSAGCAGLTEVYTPDAAHALNARGDASARAAERAVPQAAGAPVQFTGIGSMLAVHIDARLRSAPRRTRPRPTKS